MQNSRVRRRASWIEKISISCQSVLVYSLLPSFFQPYFFDFLFICTLADHFLFIIAGIRLRPALLSHLFDAAAFRQSAPWGKIALFLIVSILGCFIGQLLPRSGPFPIPKALFLAFIGLAPFWFSTPSERRSNVFFLWESDLIQALRFHQMKAWALLLRGILKQTEYPMLRFEKPLPEGKRRFTVEIKKGEKPHVIFLFLESFRAKNIGSLSGSISLSPAFDKWSKEGILFTQFHSNGVLTSSAMISSLFGILPMFHPSYLRSYLSIPLRGIPQILREQGYENGMILGGPGSFQSWERFFELNDFHEIIGKREIAASYSDAESTSWGVHDEWIYKKALSWLTERKNPAFLTLLTATHHHPWQLPNSWKGRKADHPYHRTFSYSDWALGEWLAAFERSGLMEKSLIFILGDHGQELGERGEKSLVNRHLYQENIHVPLLLLAKGRLNKPQRFLDPCSQIDLLPTLLDLLNIGTIHHGMGESLLLKPRTKPHFFLHPFQESFAAVRIGPWKCILNRSSGKKELYQLESDHDEKEDLSLSQPQITRYLEKKILSQLSVLDSLYSARAFAPHQNKKAPLHLDFSLEAVSLTHLKEKGSRISALNLSHRLFVNDEFIIFYSIYWTRLTRIDLSHCLLVTDRGVNRLINSCPQLEEIDLRGLDEFSGTIDSHSPHLRLLNLLQCKMLNPVSTICWLQKLNSLTELGLNGENFSQNDWKRLFEILPLVSVLFIENGLEMRPEAFLHLLAKNIYLKYITLENCPEITDESLVFLKNRELRSLCLTSCPKVTSRTLDALFDLPLQKLFLKDCPSIESAAIERWRQKGGTIVSAT